MDNEKVPADFVERILAFEIDDPESSLPFSGRLAREQGWTLAFTARVIEEYKRFLTLAMVAGHPVTPSEDIDQAWHLHLLYTRNYWLDLCRDTLGQDLHHGPTKGGTTEGDKFYDWYSKTIGSYQRVFGSAPPEDIWPSPPRRFANAGCARWVDTSKFWLLPKPVLRQKKPRK